MTLATANFTHLAVHDPTLVRLGALAERYFRDDLATALFKLRQFAELVGRLVAAHHAVYRGERTSFGIWPAIQAKTAHRRDNSRYSSEASMSAYRKNYQIMNLIKVRLRPVPKA